MMPIGDLRDDLGLRQRRIRSSKYKTDYSKPAPLSILVTVLERTAQGRYQLLAINYRVHPVPLSGASIGDYTSKRPRIQGRTEARSRSSKSRSSPMISMAQNSFAGISLSEIRTPSFSAAPRSSARRISSPASEYWAASSLSSGQWSQRPPSSGASGQRPGSHSSSRRSTQWIRNLREGCSGHSPGVSLGRRPPGRRRRERRSPPSPPRLRESPEPRPRILPSTAATVCRGRLPAPD